MKPIHWEILPARKYYQRENPGHYSMDSVLLRNGHIAHHGPIKECRDTIKRVEQLREVL